MKTTTKNDQGELVSQRVSFAAAPELNKVSGSEVADVLRKLIVPVYPSGELRKPFARWLALGTVIERNLKYLLQGTPSICHSLPAGGIDWKTGGLAG